jgi:hypothetical protein
MSSNSITFPRRGRKRLAQLLLDTAVRGFHLSYPRKEDRWENKIPEDIDILVTHGPPHLHLDSRGFHRAGCQYLAAAIARICPRMVVFGHINAAYGREDLITDRARRANEEVQSGSRYLSLLCGLLTPMFKHYAREESGWERSRLPRLLMQRWLGKGIMFSGTIPLCLSSDAHLAQLLEPCGWNSKWQ